MRLFTREGADRTLPLVRRIVRDIQDTFGKARAAVAEAASFPSDVERQDRVQELESRLRELVEELHQIGAELKDPGLGLVDFPCLMDDRPAYLCWKPDEERVAFWHGVDEGYAGRRPL